MPDHDIPEALAHLNTCYACTRAYDAHESLARDPEHFCCPKCEQEEANEQWCIENIRIAMKERGK